MSNSEYFRTHECGKQWTALELPDVVHLHLRGQCTLEECRMINAAHFEYAEQVTHFFYLIDLSELEDLPPAVRREASETVKQLPVRGTVVLSAPLRARVLAKLLLTAANLFRRGPEKNPVVFEDSPEQARPWFDRWRELLSKAA